MKILNASACIVLSILIRTSLYAQVPTISSFTPTSGLIGTEVTITGTNFHATPANNIVFFGATQAAVSAATGTTLTVSVPTGATYMPITVLVNGLIAYSSMPFITTFDGGEIDANSFATAVDYTTGTIQGPLTSGIAIGDLDGDGKSDLAITNNINNTISIFKNLSNSGTIDATSFASKVDYTTGLNPVSISIGDLDGDGKADLAVTNRSGNTISILRNTSIIGVIDANSFSAKVDFTTGSTPVSVSIGDLDGDGKADLVVAGSTVSIFRNTSTSGILDANSFSPKIDFTAGSSPFSVSIADLDGDGKVDLVTANSGSNTLSVLKNNSSSGTIDMTSFLTKVDFTTGPIPLSIAAGDLDGDGMVDLVTVNNQDNTLSVLRNTSTSGTIDNSSFASKVDYTTGFDPRSVAIADLNGDGKLDLAGASSAVVAVQMNTSVNGVIDANSFSPLVDYFVGLGSASAVAIGDLDTDGKADLVAINSVGGNYSVWVRRNLIVPLDTDGDGTADESDTDDDNDGILDGSDLDPLDPTICADVDSDGCDDCSIGIDGFGVQADNTPANDGADTDADGLCDSGDPDDDNDGVPDASDSAPLNSLLCSDSDSDGCDDCSSGSFDVNNDGTDTDADGLCDSGDPDDDNDGVPDASDLAPLNSLLCSDSDSDGCDDCSSGSFDVNNDGTDTDADGLCDSGDPDDDNDGVLDAADSAPFDSFICSDSDADGCDDCSSGSLDVNNDGTDTDGDGICDLGDNENPIFQSGANTTFAENGTGLVIDINANNGDGGGPDTGINYSLSGGADQADFNINMVGVLTFANPPDFENPTDANTDNIYEVHVTANDGVLSSDQLIRVTVTDVEENQSPTIADQTFDINENSSNGTIIGTLLANDPDGDALTFSSTIDINDPFALSFSGELTVEDLTLLDFESAATWTFNVEVTDPGGLSATSALVINVVDDGVLSVLGSTNEIIVYPNPTSQLIHFEGYDQADLYIYDFQGKLVITFVINANASIDLSALTAGQYLGLIKDEGQLILKLKIIKTN